MYTHLLNRVFIPYMTYFNIILSTLTGTKQTQRIYDQQKTMKIVTECAQNFAQSSDNLTGCRNYCNLFKFNKDNYVFEGFPEFFANSLVVIKNFKAAPKSRKLISFTGFEKAMSEVHAPKSAFDIYDRVKRVLESRQKPLSDIDEALKLHKKLEKRILQ